ncbi:hypothetical protein [uncultured Ruegeria sp.]|uniref:hypothetical protein n=1 Tax=uncultured Ruegeria sp. TaxID=259304 RepID=UPI00263258B8|nr:hypothetical protein [uncultured Ruegeria sp.]
MALALTKILTVRLAVDLSGFALLGVSPGPAQIHTVTDLLLVFLVLNHLLSWFGDLKSFVAWNHPGKLSSNMNLDAPANEQVSRLDLLALRLDEYDRLLADIAEDPRKNKNRDLPQLNKELAASARSLTKSTSILDLHAKLYLWGWFLVLPLSAAMYAIWL